MKRQLDAERAGYINALQFRRSGRMPRDFAGNHCTVPPRAADPAATHASRSALASGLIMRLPSGFMAYMSLSPPRRLGWEGELSAEEQMAEALDSARVPW